MSYCFTAYNDQALGEASQHVALPHCGYTSDQAALTDQAALAASISSPCAADAIMQDLKPLDTGCMLIHYNIVHFCRVAKTKTTCAHVAMKTSSSMSRKRAQIACNSAFVLLQ